MRIILLLFFLVTLTIFFASAEVSNSNVRLVVNGTLAVIHTPDQENQETLKKSTNIPGKLIIINNSDKVVKFEGNIVQHLNNIQKKKSS